MCGLAGIVSPRPEAGWNLPEALESMTDSLSHRGPDDHGYWTDEEHGVFLGFRRLSIIDLSQAGHQPMLSHSGRYVLTFNGEIYNHRDLKTQVTDSGLSFRGHSDTEVLTAAFDAWGVSETVPKLRGMYGFVVWDKQERTLWIVRDRMGIKPMYLLESPRGIAFASEARAFHECPLFDGRTNPSVARAFATRLYVPGPASILSGVRRVRPGSILEFRVDGDTLVKRSERQYWHLPDRVRASAGRLSDEREVFERFEALVRESVDLRLNADVPVGAFLSGGIDSTAVVGMMQELSSEPVRTFTVGFEEADFDEARFAEEVAQRVGTRHTTVRVSPAELIGWVDDLPSIADEPIANPSVIPTLMVSKVARRDVIVALTGDGGDECFAGYNRYLRGRDLMRFRRSLPGFLRTIGSSSLRRGIRSRALQAASQKLGGQQSVVARSAKIERLLASGSDEEAYSSLLDAGWLHSDDSNGVGPSEAIAAFRGEGPRDLLERMLLHDQMEYLPDDLLAKVDRATMWESLEARVPFLDHKVVDFSWTIGSDAKIRDGKTKWPIRQLASRYVPMEMLERPKMGFTVPVARWLRDDLKEWARDQLSDGAARHPGLYRRDELDRAWAALEGGRTDLALGLWALVVMQQWAARWNVDFEVEPIG